MKTLIVSIVKSLSDRFDFVFPVAGGSAGGVFGILTFGEIANTAISAAIFALVGGVIGYFVSKILKRWDKLLK